MTPREEWREAWRWARLARGLAQVWTAPSAGGPPPASIRLGGIAMQCYKVSRRREHLWRIGDARKFCRWSAADHRRYCREVLMCERGDS